LTNDPQGKLVPDFLTELNQCLGEEQETILKEVDALTKGIEHIKQIVAAQQTIAKGSNLFTPTEPATLMDAAIAMNGYSFERHAINVVRDYQAHEAISLDKHKVLQILINLINNARQSIKGSGGPGPRRITVSVRSQSSAAGRSVQFTVADTGTGIAPEHLTRVFAHGFTTKSDGHGFGLHSSANAAREMGGSLTVESPGMGLGATFTLELPINQTSEAEKR
jgi:signal transduction histidine kinase